MSLNRSLVSSGLLVAGALVSLLAPGAAKAVLNCTFGNTTACTNSAEGNLQFSNFSFSGTGAEGVDAIQVSQTGPGEIYTIAFNAGGVGQFDSEATLSFTITPINGYTLGAAGVSSTVNTFVSPYFSFEYSSGNLPTLTTSGNTVSPVPFTSPLTSSNIVIKWSEQTATASGTSLNLNLQPPSTVPVPGPLPILGAASAFGFSRRIRNRSRLTA